MNKRFGKKQWWMALCLCVCFLAGCEEAELTPDPVPGINGMLLFNLGSAMSSQSKVRVILFSAPTEAGNKSFRYNKLFTGLSGFNVPLYPGEYNDVYTVIDEEEDLSSVAGWSSFAAVKISRNLPAVNATKQRYYEYKNIHALNDGTGKILYNGADISKTGLRSSMYTMARVFLSFDLNPVLDGVNLRFREAELSNVPGFGYLYPKAYDGTDYMKKTIPLGTSIVTGGRYKFETQLLVPEYLLAAGNNRRMTLTVRADRYRGAVKEGSSEYTVNVGNDIVAGNTSRDVNRNKVYTFKFTGVTGLGQQVDDWQVKAAVEAWDERTVESEIGEAYGFFLQTEKIDDFKAYRMPRYVSFKATGPGKVWVDKPRELNWEDTVARNDFVCDVVWDDDSHRSGQLALKLGNWRTGVGFSVRIKLRANNIEKTLVVNCAGARFASRYLDAMSWAEGMGYTNEANSGFNGGISQDAMIRLYSQGDAYRGCAGYYEGTANDPLTGRGCWRMSTIREGLFYMRLKGGEYLSHKLWASEIMWSNKAYTASGNGHIPTGDLHHPGDPYYPPAYRNSLLKVLCVQDDKLEKYYHVEVNRADHSGEVSFTEAQRICQNLTEGGKTGWRLPTAAEGGYALLKAGREGIPNNFNAALYWLANGQAAGLTQPGGTTPPGGVANVRCVRNRW